MGSGDASDDASFIAHLVCIDRSTLTRECIARQLAMLFPEFLVSALSSPAELRDEAERLNRIGCIIYHIHSFLIEDEQVFQDLSLLQKIVNGVRIVVLSDLETTENVIGAMRCGVAGYVPTSFSLKIASEAIRLVLAGGAFIPVSALPFTLRAKSIQNAVGVGAASASVHFTPRQSQVMHHLWEGEPNKTIARALHMSEGTVKLHIRHIMKKLRVSNRTQVVLITRQMLGGNGQRESKRPPGAGHRTSAARSSK
jgi:DNA-binding NarL/FixJ family response regulator